MAKILITGSRGTIGTPLTKELIKRGHDVWQVDLQHCNEANYIRADISEYRQLERVFKQNYDYVYHLAAEFGRINGEEYYEQVWKTNVIGTRNILEFQQRLGFKLIFTSSSEIYGEPGNLYLNEELPETLPLFQHNDYAISKWVNELQIVNFQKKFHTSTIRVRLFNAYGPGELYHPYRSVVCLFCYRALHNQPFQVYKNYHRVFMYIDDLIPTLANIVDRFMPGRVYNIGGNEYRSVEELAELVLQYTGASRDLVQILPEDTHNTVNKRPDITKAVTELGHSPRIPLEEGIPNTIRWLQSIYEPVRVPVVLEEL
ncbi:dTDP-glucose 4,6-dehydratase [Hydrogenispora ethanolica]|uniref:dTDP-glucose 4,6-dehydratase n=1 Tax=Hydrogenispora ethanolica TaxID=1082276 RepID=A0A4R1R4E1_HYDET|nr:NAD(P)-dependent oxidoreductase [Hydrogenispora ethanolica]TCL60288.1 dTDP-glucose 4,6-dehydratase [Hydrogenispora ethanolica]